MTLQQLLAQGTQQLNSAGVPDAKLDARYLLLSAFEMSLASFLAGGNREISSIADGEKRAEAYLAFVERRAKRIPLQQLLGVQGVHGTGILCKRTCADSAAGHGDAGGAGA